MNYTHGETFERQNLTFIYLKDHKSIDYEQIKHSDIYILDCSANQFVQRVINSIKSAEEASIYLKPLLLYDQLMG